MIEHEIKLMLTEKEYEYICAMFADSCETLKQINYYYDTNNFEMNKKGITCRVRNIGDYYCATMKTHKNTAFGISEETSFVVYSVAEVMDFFGFHLRKQGCLTTYRTNLKADFDILVTLDKNTYLGIEDHELEIEYDEEKCSLAYGFLRELSETMYFDSILRSQDELLLRAGTGKSKSSRFFERREEMKL